MAALPPSGVDVTLYRQLSAFEFIQVATLSVLAWEIIVTLPMELALYRKGFKPTYLVLTLGRYYTLICLVLDVALNLVNDATAEFCHSIRWVLPFLSTTIQFAAIPLLLLRTYAIWGRNKTIGFILMVFWIGPLIIGSYVATTYEGIPYAFFLRLDVLGGCGNDPTNNWGTAPFIVNMIVDSSIFLLTLGKLLVTRQASAVAGSTIRRLLIRDGILYYIVVVAINVINIVFFLAPGLPPLARPLIATPATIAPAIMVGRLFFNLQNNFLSSDPVQSHSSSSQGSSHRRISLTTSTANAPGRRDVYPLGPMNVKYTVDVKRDTSPSDNDANSSTKGNITSSF